MFVDTSVVVAVLAREPEAGEFASKIEHAMTAFTAGHVLLEASMRLSARRQSARGGGGNS